MTCAEYREYTSAWFDGEAIEASFEDLVGHIHHCVQCRAFMSRLPRQAALLREIPGAGTAFASLKQQDAEGQERGLFALPGFNIPMAIAAAIILIVLTVAVEQNVSDARQASAMDRSAIHLEVQGKGIR